MIDQPTFQPKQAVVFSTSMFGQVHNGPALYANYLWDRLRDDPEIGFHLVTPQSDITHPRIHLSGTALSSRKLYRQLQLKTINVAQSLNTKNVIIHSNNAHCMSLLKPRHGHLIGQFNDYDAAKVFLEPLNILKRHGLRRFASLAVRHVNESSALKKLDLAICNSNFLRAELIKRYKNANNSKLAVIYKSIDWNEFSQDTETQASDRSKKNLLFVGSNWNGKGLDIALKALAQLPPEFNSLKLTVAGDGRKAAKPIRQLISQLNINSRVEFLGNVPRKKMPRLMANSSVLLFPSHNEALGVTAIEAVASMLPVVASNVGGIPEVLAETTSSHLISNDPSTFSYYIQNVLKSYPKTTNLQNDSDAVKNKFNCEQMIDSVKQMYSSFR
ncbi:glycosyltransferase family 4 protein [Mariniblastus sp.]|nr:glycosyltransferase family 4 protein [Mariniblastus sp.]